VYSSSSVARSEGSVVVSFSRRCSPGIVGVLQELIAQLEKSLLEEGELRLVHVVLFRCLEQVLLGEDLDLFRDRRGRRCRFRCMLTLTSSLDATRR
jgi:hypothetical protein